MDQPSQSYGSASTNRHVAVAGGADPGNGIEPPEITINDRGYNFPNSRRIYAKGEIHPDIRVPFFVIPSEVEGSLDTSVRL